METFAYNFGYLLGIGIGMGIIFSVYFLPSIIAFFRKNENIKTVIVVNAFAIFCFPWFIALALSFKK